MRGGGVVTQEGGARRTVATGRRSVDAFGEAAELGTYRAKGDIDGSDDGHDKCKRQWKLLLALHAGFHWQNHAHTLIGVDHHAKQEWQITDGLEVHHLCGAFECPKVIVKYNNDACNNNTAVRTMICTCWTAFPSSETHSSTGFL